MEKTDRPYWLAFSAFPGVGPVRFALLLSHFGSAKKAWHASTEDLLKINFGEKLTAKFSAFRRAFDVEGYARRVKDLEIATVILTDEKYPLLLKQISDPPFVLYIKGRKSSTRSDLGLGLSSNTFQGPTLTRGGQSATVARKNWDISKSIAVVGTRKITSYGREVTKLLTEQLVAAGLTIVSGLAFGVDAQAHQTAIESDGKTIAVLGCGVDCVNPPSNKWLYEKIINGNGIVVSEMPLSHEPTRGLFPARNRIISGLSLGVLVTEGAQDSGSLITASNAAEQGREVFAVPGPITSSLSKGPTSLIKKGAKLVATVEDILEEFQMSNVKYQISNRTKGSTEEERIIAIIENEPVHFDEIVRLSGMETGRIGGLLSVMEIKGMVRNVGNNLYKLA